MPSHPYARFLIPANSNHESQKKAAAARNAKQKIIEVKEIKMRPNIDLRDYEVKMKAVRRFFDAGDKVKLTLRL